MYMFKNVNIVTYLNINYCQEEISDDYNVYTVILQMSVRMCFQSTLRLVCCLCESVVAFLPDILCIFLFEITINKFTVRTLCFLF